jgi:hypothetical protein
VGLEILVLIIAEQGEQQVARFDETFVDLDAQVDHRALAREGAHAAQQQVKR